VNLPNDSLGITDLIAHRECPRRMSYGLRRHSGPGEQSDDRTPEAGSYATAYGSAIHAAIQMLEEGREIEDAIQVAWNEHGAWLEPGDLELLRRDLDTYRQRDFPNTRTVLSEDEIRVPLFIYKGRQIYFRAKVDRLYERLDESMGDVLRRMEAERRADLGYELRPRGASVFTPQAAEALHERLGERFYELVGLTKSGLESALAEDPDLLAWALSLADERDGSSVLAAIR
jgi:hypothetical protein